VPAGVCFGFLGPNGAGKTTTLKMLSGLLIPTEGRIFVNGYDIQKEPIKAKQDMAFIPDNPFIYDKLTGREFLDFILDIYGCSKNGVKQKREELLETFSLTEWQDELVENYSHGMKQKLIITGAFIHEPKLLVIDEPMVGLDPYGHKLVKKLFREFVEDGNTIFLSTHQLSVAEEICDRISIIDHGEVVATGSVEELQRTARTESGHLESIFLKLTDKP
jgi:ABC-2 type transport system ATP-binding protein